MKIFNAINELKNDFKPDSTLIIITESKKIYIFRDQKIKIFDLQFIYLNNQNYQSFFIESNQNDYILEQSFEKFLNLNILNTIVQLLSYNNKFEIRIKEFVPEVFGNYIKETYVDNVKLISFDENYFIDKFPSITVKASCNIYDRIKNKNGTKKIIFVDLGHYLFLKFTDTDTKDINFREFYILKVIIEFRKFLYNKFKVVISNFRSGKILKCLPTLNESFFFYSLSNIIEIQSRDLILFFGRVLKNFKSIEYKGEDIYILSTFFTEKTTIDILKLIFKKVIIGKKRKREELIDIFLYDNTLSLSQLTITEFLIKNKVIVTENNSSQRGLTNLFEENNKKIFEFLLFLKVNKYNEFITINLDLITFFSLKSKKFFFNENETVKSLVEKYNFSKINKNLLDKNIFDILKLKNVTTFFKQLVEDKLFYYLKYNCFYIYGENFLYFKLIHIKELKNKFSLIKENLKEQLSKDNLDYFKDNSKFFINLEYIPKTKRKKIR